MFERILVPLDGSPLAEAILSQVRRILFRKDAEIILAQAVSVPTMMEGDVSRVLSAIEQQATAYLKGLEKRLADQGARVRYVVRVGTPAETILDISERERVSLIAMSTHGRSGLSRWVFGSVAEKVLRASAAPLLLVRSFAPDGNGKLVPAAGELRLTKILVPIDASDTAMEIVPAAAELARLLGAHVLVLNVCEEHPQCSVPVPQITHAYERFRDAGLTTEPLMKKGDPAEQILEACREQSADLIAMSTHGRSGVTRWVLGSVAEKVLRAATVPLLLVRSSRTSTGKVGIGGRREGARA